MSNNTLSKQILRNSTVWVLTANVVSVATVNPRLSMASENSTGEESLQIQPQGDVEKELPQILGMDVQDDGVWGGRKAERKRKK